MTPLHGAVHEKLAQKFSRFHTPGHKGRLPELQDAAHHDLTEITGLDSLYESSGVIAETEAAFAKRYATRATLLSAGGSTLCIQTMLALAAAPGSTIIADRNLHRSAVGAMALLDLRPVWLYPEEDAGARLFAPPPSPAALERLLREHPDASCVFATGTTFPGAVADVAALSAVCRRYHVPLLVDNAQGAHLKFLPGRRHPVDRGADLCCDSLHKTLPVLTGGALLHICRDDYTSRGKQMMALFGSTSPSYLILLSADRMLEHTADELRARLSAICARLADCRVRLRQRGYHQDPATDPMRLCFSTQQAGGADAVNHLLQRHGIEPELLDSRLCVLLAGYGTTQRDLGRLQALTAALPPALPAAKQALEPLRPQRMMTLLDAMFAAQETVLIDHAMDRICAELVAPCPPGVALLHPGEHICEQAIQLLRQSGLPSIRVVRPEHKPDTTG